MLPLRMVLLIVLFWELVKVSGPVPLIGPDRTAVRPLPLMVLVVAEPVGLANTKLVLYDPGALIRMVPPESVAALVDEISVDWPAGT